MCTTCFITAIFIATTHLLLTNLIRVGEAMATVSIETALTLVLINIILHVDQLNLQWRWSPCIPVEAFHCMICIISISFLLFLSTTILFMLIDLVIDLLTAEEAVRHIDTSDRFGSLC